ncbi:MAG TPA: VWA domain-containing protein [Candidatus Acidoferrales bacterium]|nr:VWA domain-containing protein [Candidatus Acidoferrales bacterium]
MKRTADRVRPLALLVGLAFALPLFGQSQPPGPLQLKPGVQAQQQNQKPPVINIRVNVVTLPVAVATKSGQPVLDLAKKDFEILDDQKPQEIIRFDQGGDPLSIVLVLETSSRVAPLLPEVAKTGIIFTQMVMAGNGEAAVIGYNDEVDLLRPMTTDSDRVLDAINHVKPGLDGARLYDAMDRAEVLLEAQPPERRRIIIVVGEKNDKGSEMKLGQVLRRAQLDNTTIYSIGLSTTAAEFRQPPQQKPNVEASPPGTYPMNPPPGTAQTPQVMDEEMGNQSVPLLPLVAWLVEHGANAVGRNSLEIASQGTGGLHKGAMKDRTLENDMNAIGNDIHGNYLLAYRPSANQAYGYHNIEVRVLEPGLRVRARPGYYLAPPTQ